MIRTKVKVKALLNQTNTFFEAVYWRRILEQVDRSRKTHDTTFTFLPARRDNAKRKKTQYNLDKKIAAKYTPHHQYHPYAIFGTIRIS